MKRYQPAVVLTKEKESGEGNNKRGKVGLNPSSVVPKRPVSKPRPERPPSRILQRVNSTSTARKSLPKIIGGGGSLVRAQSVKERSGVGRWGGKVGFTKKQGGGLLRTKSSCQTEKGRELEEVISYPSCNESGSYQSAQETNSFSTSSSYYSAVSSVNTNSKPSLLSTTNKPSSTTAATTNKPSLSTTAVTTNKPSLSTTNNKTSLSTSYPYETSLSLAFANKSQTSKVYPRLVRKVPLPTLSQIFRSDASTVSEPSLLSSSLVTSKKWSLADFQFGRPLGKGRFGKVFMARVRNTNLVFALKTLDKKETIRYKLTHCVGREINLHGQLHHPNILRLYTHFSDNTHVYLVLEYAPRGELFSMQKEVGRFTEAVASRYTAQIASALHYLHANNIIHRDLKPENILVGIDGRLLLGDFGWAVLDKAQKRVSKCGTPDYIAPEIVEDMPYGSAVDLWALGVLAYEFLVGRPPFEADDDGDQYTRTYAKIAKVEYKFPSYVSPNAQDFISKLLQYKPADRLSLDQVACHPWITTHAPSTPTSTPSHHL